MSGRAIIAIVRPPSNAIRDCEITHIERDVIDVEQAIRQHAAYAALLRDLGAEVTVLPPEPELPDAVFVEDVAVVLDEIAVATNPGAPSRRAEVASVAAALEPHRPIHRILEPGTLDGGDVVVAERTVYVGLSSRTNEEGIRQLVASLAPFGYDVRPVLVSGCLHLKSACTYAGDGVFVVNERWVDPEDFDPRVVVRVPPSEPRAANTFRVGEALVMAAGAQETASLLRGHGFAVHEVDLSELQKAEAAGSCMSLIFRG